MTHLIRYGHWPWRVYYGNRAIRISRTYCALCGRRA